MEALGVVSPTPIRLRILKAPWFASAMTASAGFTHSDPFEDTESSCGVSA